ncbi:TonB-dependent receptor [uncultured Paraglaciecola sp.]|jgi:iron complex outermembrane recepter protein|uniref:TonB-dependent receptor n=1 Tax=uncultured Paraglaciecola sp. TaxID=1765024 RepID=UPI0025E661BC|nr:TonB-dependent receptor [uncultured Paraglaciecola sp.]
MKKNYLWTAVKAALILPAATLSISSVIAQEAAANDAVEVIEVRGIVSSLKRAMSNKKESLIVSDGIAAEDLGKFPDLNVAESLQRITGVSIDRSGGEGQFVTVRGFGPQFNNVLVNGRQIATENPGREFSFDILAAEMISGADVYKSTRADLQEGGIGATINVSTARPFDIDGFRVAGSAKATYEDLNEKTSPSASVLISNTFNDDRLGVLFSASHQQRDVDINSIGTAGWRPGITVSNTAGDVLASNIYIPRNIDHISDVQERTRTNASLVVQYAPSDEISITFDGFMSEFEVDSVQHDLAAWYEPTRVGSVTVDPETRTATFIDQVGGNAATDFVENTQGSRNVSINAFGLNVEWDIQDNLKGNFDLSTSSAENDTSDGSSYFAVIGIVNNYQTSLDGGNFTTQHDGFSGNTLPDASLGRSHVYGKSGVDNEDEVTELRADFIYTPDSDTFTQMKFGAYMQDREKSIQNFSHTNNIAGMFGLFGGYRGAVPAGTLQPYTANNFFNGVADTWYTYDGGAFFDVLSTDTSLQLANDATLGVPDGTTAAIIAANNGWAPERLGDYSIINEEVTSLYMDFVFQGDLGDMPWTVNIGARYSETSISVDGAEQVLLDVIATSDTTLFQNVLGDAVPVSRGSSYANLLPSVNFKLDVQDDMVLRFSVYDSLTRPTLSQLSSVTNIGEPRLQNLTASGGNPALKPFKSENWDISYEWYFGDASSFTFAYFNKEVDDFITTLRGTESIILGDRANTPGNICGNCAADQLPPGAIVSDELQGASEDFFVSRPQNGETAEVNGFEVAVTHVWDNGFGFTANATVVNSDAEIDTTVSQTFALEGLGDSQNLIVFYEQDEWQARIAFNNREAFLQELGNATTGEPNFVETYGQWDASASYDINENLTVFVEGINLTGEETVKHGRFPIQITSIQDTGTRYAIGVRANF